MRKFLAALLLLMAPAAPAFCQCPSLNTDKGTDAASITVPSAGTYNLWVRLWAPDSVNDSVTLQLDGTVCGVDAGDGGLPAKTWTWVNYKNGDPAQTMSSSLAAGAHSLEILGREDGVRVDRVMAISGGCAPVGTGSNCLSPPAAPRNLRKNP